MPADASTPRGAFIVIEGLDRSGKTTQVTKLKLRLESKGLEVEQLRFPDRTTTIGTMINEYLQSKAELEDHVVHLLFSANRWELASRIESILAAGTTIVCDRYYYSGMVYSAAKQNPTLPLIWARNPEVGLPRPDKVIFLNLSPEEAEKRGGYGEEKYEKREMQERVRKLFMELKNGTSDESEDMIVIDAGYSVQEVEDKVGEAVDLVMEQVAKGEHGPVVKRVAS